MVKRHRSNRTILSTAICVASLTIASLLTATPANAAPSGPCSAFMVVIGVRGTNAPAGTSAASGGRVWRSGGFGSHVQPIIDRIGNGNADVRNSTYIVSLNYPAKAEVNLIDNSASYISSRNAGVAALKAELESYMACTYRPAVMLVGYSQGADVIATTLGSSMNSTAKGQVKGAVVMGDPSYRSGQPVNAPGNNQTGNGMWWRTDATQNTLNSLRTYGWNSDTNTMSNRNVLREYCNAGDAACQGNYINWAAHADYDKYADPAAVFLNNFLFQG